MSNIILIRGMARDSGQMDNWQNEPKTRKLVKMELQKIILYVKMGILQDLNVRDL
ncbi:MAG: hypothetical protein ACO1OT_06550 [Heyndrickxia sp.]